ncbi:Zinc-transporting ATPase [anaerobic digester metagenome]
MESASISLPNESLRILAPQGIGDAVIQQAEKIVAHHEPQVRFRPVRSPESGIKPGRSHPGEGEPHDHEAHEHGHSHGHSHDHGDDADKTGPFGIPLLHWNLLRIVVSLGLFLGSFLAPRPWSDFMLFVAYGLAGYEIVLAALRNLTRGLVFDENFLMTLATVGAFAIGEYQEAVGVMLFYMIGEYFQDLAVHRSRKSIKDLLDIRPDYAMVLVDGELIRRDPLEVAVEDLIVVRPGERVPLDGMVTEGYSQLDTKALTGESIPREIQSGDEILSGSVNITSALTIRVTRPFGESTVSRIMDLVENSAHQKGKTEKFITKFARVYTPAVVLLASLVAFLVPLILSEPFSPWIRKGLIFLVVSCPCALVISIPLGFFGGLGLASRHGILIKGSNFLEELKNLDTIVLDKTGTVTKGTFEVTQIESAEGVEVDEVLKLAALAELDSPHPIAKSILDQLDEAPQRSSLISAEEIRGKGRKATLPDGTIIWAGNQKLMEDLGISLEPPEGTIVYVARQSAGETQYLGSLQIEDELKPDSKQAIADLKSMGVSHLVMLSGDNRTIVKKVAAQSGIDDYRAELLPQDKVTAVEEITQKQGQGKFTAFAGDGLNDTPVLKMADIGISMGSIGSSAAIEASDVVLMDDSLLKIPLAINISRLTNRIVLQNVILALGIKLAVMIHSVFFNENIWLAIFADVGVALLAVLNASRLSRMDPAYAPTQGTQMLKSKAA